MTASVSWNLQDCTNSEAQNGVVKTFEILTLLRQICEILPQLGWKLKHAISAEKSKSVKIWNSQSEYRDLTRQDYNIAQRRSKLFLPESHVSPLGQRAGGKESPPPSPRLGRASGGKASGTCCLPEEFLARTNIFSFMWSRFHIEQQIIFMTSPRAAPPESQPSL